MTDVGYSYYTEVIQMRVETLEEGGHLREEVMVDTIKREYEMIEYLKERLVHCDSERFK
ncbi:MAG: hypothetical protein J6F30_06230 [Cellulosilyticum sp.]|nr:hypothetical protein [Cellulosilyticum sp.]